MSQRSVSSNPILGAPYGQSVSAVDVNVDNGIYSTIDTRYIMKDDGSVYYKREYPNSSQSSESLQNEIDIHSAHIDLLKKDLEFINSLPIKAKEAAFHKEHGTVLVKGVVINRDDFEHSHYEIVTINRTSHFASVKEVLPLTDATKILYGKD